MLRGESIEGCMSEIVGAYMVGSCTDGVIVSGVVECAKGEIARVLLP